MNTEHPYFTPVLSPIMGANSESLNPSDYFTPVLSPIMGANSESLNPSDKPMARGGEKPFLHFDIIINILKRFPVKSILRFRSVCKDWKNLFKTQYFIAEHTRHSAHESPFLALHEYDYSSRHPSLRLLNQKMETVRVVEVLSIRSHTCFNHGWGIIGSCNGLLCVECWRLNLLCLWNPVNREVRKIPQTWEDCRGHSMFGFGFSSIVNDYKIVRFFHDRKKLEGLNSKVRVVKVYSLSTDSWKELEPGAVQKTRFKFGTVSVSVDGTMTWLGDEDSLPVLVSFDIVTEVFTLTPIPSVIRVPPTTLGVYQNKFVISGYHRESHFMDIWVMEQVASESGKHFSCSEKYSVDVPSYALALDIFCIWGNEIVCCDKERKVGLEGKSEYNLKLFNLTTKEWKESPNISSAHDCCAGFSYRGSLVSLFNPQVQ